LKKFDASRAPRTEKVQMRSVDKRQGKPQIFRDFNVSGATVTAFKTLGCMHARAAEPSCNVDVMTIEFEARKFEAKKFNAINVIN
jgi:hypothetical protein